MKRLLLVLSMLFLGGFEAPVACAQEDAQEPAKQALPENVEFEKDTIIIRKESGEEHIFNVELAQTPPQFQRGLMFREELPEDFGMLFLFPDYIVRGFWMKNTLVPLDLFFLTAAGEIHHIHENAIPHDLSVIAPTQPSKAVLEAPGGTAERLGIQVGDTIEHSFFELINKKKQTQDVTPPASGDESVKN